jgi:hypothetical protein
MQMPIQEQGKDQATEEKGGKISEQSVKIKCMQEENERVTGLTSKQQNENVCANNVNAERKATTVNVNVSITVQ